MRMISRRTRGLLNNKRNSRALCRPIRIWLANSSFSLIREWGILSRAKWAAHSHFPSSSLSRKKFLDLRRILLMRLRLSVAPSIKCSSSISQVLSTQKWLRVSRKRRYRLFLRSQKSTNWNKLSIFRRRTQSSFPWSKKSKKILAMPGHILRVETNRSSKESDPFQTPPRSSPRSNTKTKWVSFASTE